MTDILTDSKQVTITIKTHGNLTIENLSNPTYSWVGETLVVSYDVVNSGGEDNCYCQIKEGTNVLDRQTLTINTNESITHSLIFGTAGNKNLTIEVGYIE